ncbi:MAG: hypothetical protein HYV13_03630, partial [Candidatus Doudnabacteria bacterium]|nr:hypothetical protein [Candidatus Doudnabacteria bacterium]
MSILGKKLILVTYLAVFALGGLAFNWSDWHLTSASKQALTLLDISPSVLSLKHEAQDIASDLKDSVALVFDYLEQRQQTVALSRIAGESLDNNSPQPPLNLRETPSLTSRRGLGDSALGEAGELYPQEVTKVIREVNNYTLKASLTEQELLDLISASDQLKQMLKGEKGDKGEQGSQGPAGAGITYSSPNIQNPGSFGGITYFGAKDIRTETINATSTATLNSLTVTNGGTLSGQLTITRVPSVAHVFTTWPSGVSGVSDSSIYINPASATADSNLLGLAVNGTVKFLVDAEGDIYGNNLVLSGSTSQGQTTIAGNLTVQDSTTFGDASTDTLTFTAVSNSNLTFKKADPSLILDVTTATDTDFWLGVQDDAGSDDDDTFQIGDGITPGTNTFLTLDTSGNLTLSSLTASRLVFNDANKALSSSSSSSIVAASLTDETGSGVLVFSTSPTLVTPALGTPSALVGTNITGTASGLTAGNVTTNANLTGPITSVGNATSIAAQTGTGTTFVMNTS